mmetsp:Transcript_139631/g.446789  ORF Transcript_139631/g.446789 Transcript_139631/m.446789 type:complete len:248 (+) Transcript_139631:220-963(+)
MGPGRGAASVAPRDGERRRTSATCQDVVRHRRQSTGPARPPLHVTSAPTRGRGAQRRGGATTVARVWHVFNSAAEGELSWHNVVAAVPRARRGRGHGHRGAPRGLQRGLGGEHLGVAGGELRRRGGRGALACHTRRQGFVPIAASGAGVGDLEWFHDGEHQRALRQIHGRRRGEGEWQGDLLDGQRHTLPVLVRGEPGRQPRAAPPLEPRLGLGPRGRPRRPLRGPREGARGPCRLGPLDQRLGGAG